MTRADSGYLDTTKLSASLLLSGPLPSVVVEDSDPGDTTELTASLLLLGPLPSVVVEGSDPR
jgi:hypothetical protein